MEILSGILTFHESNLLHTAYQLDHEHNQLDLTFRSQKFNPQPPILKLSQRVN